MINKKKISFKTESLYPLVEKGRVDALKSYQILDSSPENDYDEITFLASKVFKCPISFISFIDEDRLWLKSSKGFARCEIERNFSFCNYTILEDDLLIINDTLKDERFLNSPFVLGNPFIRFYAAAPILSPLGFKIGALSIMDNKVNELSESEKLYLKFLANRVVKLLELRRKKILLAKINKDSFSSYEKIYKKNNALEAMDFNEIKTTGDLCNLNKHFLSVNSNDINELSRVEDVQKNYDSNIKSNFLDLERLRGKLYKRNVLNVNYHKFFTKNFMSEDYQSISIDELVNVFMGFYREKLNVYDIKLNVTLEISPNFKVDCKPSLVMRGILLLLNNSIQAIKFKKFKWIHVGFRELNHEIEFSIADNSLRENRFKDKNQNRIFFIDKLNFESNFENKNMKYLNEIIYSQGGEVLLDSTLDHTRIIILLPKRNYKCNH